VNDVPEALADGLRDRYQIDRRLGSGGMATVYLAHDQKHDRPVALKLLRPELAVLMGTERFLREIRLSARLQHPNILAVHDSGEIGGQLWFTMPYVDGETLRSLLNREKQLPLDDALRIAGEVADALDYAHRHGIIHRDIKPENILLSGPAAGERGRAGRHHALLADFGIAQALSSEPGSRLTESGITIGTPLYMSPEQATAQRSLDGRSDIYALGCVLYEMLAGEPPFTGPSPQAILAKRMTEPLPSLRTTREVPVGVEQAVTRALARAPADRFATAGEFADALEVERTTGPRGGVAPARAPGPRVVRARTLTGVLSLFVVAAGYLAFRLMGRPDEPPLASAAVLPFADLSPLKDQEYFSDGLTDELIATLSRVPGLRVAARSSSFQFKGRSPDVHEVARRLDVGTVLEGSVRRSGSRLRVTTQLINARDGYQLWSETYDRDLSDVFVVQEDVARSIVSALQVHLTPGRDSALGRRPTTDLAAYDLYLKGRFAWNQRTGPALQEAVRYQQQAVARDSNFARAWAALADAWILVVPYHGGSPEEGWHNAQVAARKALALDPASAEAYTSLAYGSMVYGWSWAEAEEDFRRAITADPNYPTGHHWYGDFLAGRGRLNEALAEMSRAHQLDPLSRQIGTEWGWVSYLMHQYDTAEVHIRQTLELEPNYAQARYRLGLVQLQQRRYPEAIVSLRRAIDLGVFYPQAAAALAVALAATGDRAGATAIVNDLQRRPVGELVPPIMIAIGYTGLGDATRAFQWLNRGIDQRDIYIPENFFDPLLDPLRSDPRYPSVVARMGLAPPR
jgi:eukaryotic-like serine/threonine-protein kinase